jgi:hypothetical protein
MQGENSEAQLRFALPTAAKGAQFLEVCRNIGEQCRSRKATRAMLVADTLQITEGDLKGGLVALASTGCSPGFKLACVTPIRQSFEALVKVEDSALSQGISVRIFFDEDNARRWLAW